jgi:hypothetical protein
MFVFPSPPDASERIPGIVLKISAVVRGADCKIAAGFKVVIDTLDSNLDLELITPVTTISSNPQASIVSVISICPDFSTSILKEEKPV